MRQLLVIPVLALSALGSFSGVAWAAQPAPVQITATFVGPQTVTGYRQADGNTFITFIQDMALSGGVTGSLTEIATLELHPDGSGTDQATATGTWTVDGKTGDVTLVASLSIEPNRPMPAEGHFTIVNATAVCPASMVKAPSFPVLRARRSSRISVLMPRALCAGMHVAAS